MLGQGLPNDGPRVLVPGRGDRQPGLRAAGPGRGEPVLRGPGAVTSLGDVWSATILLARAQVSARMARPVPGRPWREGQRRGERQRAWRARRAWPALAWPCCAVAVLARGRALLGGARAWPWVTGAEPGALGAVGMGSVGDVCVAVPRSAALAALPVKAMVAVAAPAPASASPAPAIATALRFTEPPTRSPAHRTWLRRGVTGGCESSHSFRTDPPPPVRVRRRRGAVLEPSDLPAGSLARAGVRAYLAGSARRPCRVRGGALRQACLRRREVRSGWG